MTTRDHRWMLIVAFALTGLTMRAAVTSVGAELDDLQDALHVSGVVAGLITTLPVICFAAFGALTPRMSRAVGGHRLLVIALGFAAVGTALRPIGAHASWFVLLSVAALAGGAVSNVLLPSLVKAHFPDRIGHMTAVYTTALAVGATAAAGLTVPIGDATGGGWRTGLGFWALFSALAVLPWLPTVRRDSAIGPRSQVRLPLSRLGRSGTAWALAVFFAMQSMQAYIAFGWFARFLSAHGISHATAGAMVAALSAIGIPVSIVAPRVPVRWHRAVIGCFALCNLVAYVGMATAPAAGAWAWMLLAGVGGGMFPLSLTLIGLRSHTAETTAALSAFVQAIGYVVAGSGPLLFGALFGATGSWTLPLAVLFVSLALSVVAAWPATADRLVDSELARSPA